MIYQYSAIAAWVFQIGLFGLLLATLIYARRLEAMLQRIRHDEKTVQAVLPQIDAAISAANLAVNRLMEDAGRADAALRETCEIADGKVRKLDELLGKVALANVPPAPVRVAEPVYEMSVPDAPVVAKPARAAPEAQPMRRLTPRGSAKPQSRVERDLARMLGNAS